MQDSSQRLLYEAGTVNAVSPLVWSEDSQWIYVLSAAKTPQEFLKISVEDGKAKSVFALPVDEIDGVTITPDGKQLVYAAVEKQSDVWFMEHFDAENELDSPVELSDTTEYRQLAYLEEATNLLRMKKYVEAENLSRKGLRINSRHVGLLEVLGRSLYDQQKYDEAEREFSKALDLVPDHMYILQRNHNAAFYNSNYKDARKYIKAYLDNVTRLILPKQQAYAYVRLGVIDMIAKDYTIAEHNFRSAIAIDSTNSQAIQGMGYLFTVQERYAEAEKFAFQALVLDSSFANYNLTARVLVAGESDLDRGMAFAEKALESKPENWAQTAGVYSYYAIPEHTLGLAYLKKSEYDKAVQHLEQAAAFAPQRQTIQNDLQVARQKMQEMAER